MKNFSTLILSNFQSLEDRIQLKNDFLVVGGFLRDSLQKIKFNDFDLVLKKKYFEKISKILPKISEIENFKMITLKNEGIKGTKLMLFSFQEIAFEIKEIKGKLVEDYRERDFTINALYMELMGDDLIDFGTCLEDIYGKKLKIINSKCFEFSPTRYLRYAKFKALGYKT